MPVNVLFLNHCITEAERFIVKAKTALKFHEDEAVYYKNQDKHTYGHGPANAAAKRASMDLTRALAAMRKP